jgi:galactose-1-phosphate uridylyltransferase
VAVRQHTNFFNGSLDSKPSSRGQQESPAKIDLPAYDPACYLCPGNKRAQGETNPKYENTFVFVNDYSAVKEDQAEYRANDEGPSKRLTSLSQDVQLIDVEQVFRLCY